MQLSENDRNIAILGNKETYDWVIESKRQLENGSCSVHELSETDEEEPQRN